MFDKFREECGVFGIYGQAEAARLTYLGLYALQHRGQESAGIVPADGVQLYAERGMGHVSEIFKEENLARLLGQAAIGHVRYSTAGKVSINEAQPFAVKCSLGQVALCHNGNLPDASHARRELEQAGAIFSSTSDTEVVLHRIARSRADDLEGLDRDGARLHGGEFPDPPSDRPVCVRRLGGLLVVGAGRRRDPEDRQEGREVGEARHRDCARICSSAYFAV